MILISIVIISTDFSQWLSSEQIFDYNVVFLITRKWTSIVMWEAYKITLKQSLGRCVAIQKSQDTLQNENIHKIQFSHLVQNGQIHGIKY